MKNVGKQFEDEFVSSIDEDVIYKTRLQDNPTSFKKYNDIKFVNKNPYDFQFFYKFHLFCLELKSTQESYITFDRKKDEGKMIKYHQIIGLAKASKHKGVSAGFVINFRSSEKTYFISIKNFARFMNESPKKSISEREIAMYGGVLLDATLKRVHYKYDVEKLFKYLIEQESLRED